MTVAFHRAASDLHARPERPPDIWGHGGRTLGGPVHTQNSEGGAAWLRILAVPPNRAGSKLWEGNALADSVLPPDVPRPRLLHTTEFADTDHAYRAELTTRITTPVCSTSPDINPSTTTEQPTLDQAWWHRLRQAVDTVATTPVPSGREPVISQAYVDRSIPRFLGAAGLDTTAVNTRVAAWALAHGDLHFANLTAPALVILDWEGFGAAPVGFDAANLHAYALNDPRTADAVRRTFHDILATPNGRLAELTVAAMILQAADRDPCHARLAPLVRSHAERLLAQEAGC